MYQIKVGFLISFTVTFIGMSVNQRSTHDLVAIFCSPKKLLLCSAG